MSDTTTALPQTPARLACGGRPGDRLHHDDGTMRGTARTAGGRELEWFERHARAHAERHHRGRSTAEERRLLSNAVARLRIAGCKVGHVIGHDLDRGPWHYSVTLPGDSTAGGAMRARIGHGRALRAPDVRVWADPRDPARLTIGANTPAPAFHTLMALADVLARLAPTADGTPTDTRDDDTRAFHRAELAHVIVPASEEPHYRVKVTNGLGGETKWLTLPAGIVAQLADVIGGAR